MTIMQTCRPADTTKILGFLSPPKQNCYASINVARFLERPLTTQYTSFESSSDSGAQPLITLVYGPAPEPLMTLKSSTDGTGQSFTYLCSWIWISVAILTYCGHFTWLEELWLVANNLQGHARCRFHRPLNVHEFLICIPADSTLRLLRTPCLGYQWLMFIVTPSC